MRIRLLALGASAALAFGGCTKEQAPTLVGGWEWERSVGGMTGRQVETPATHGPKTYRFSADSLFVQCGSGGCAEPVKYTLRRERSRLFGDERLVLTIRRKVYLAPPDTGYHVIRWRYLVSELSDKLGLDEDMPDGFGKEFRRK
ncbi:hypothetical protein [Hymenobacter latericus]|uniref:hypothetical protein n=1 Tax=Hymenobacter sp. YIM 151858-1 TaxID=2987688 RepID=UPI002227E572|nr:hypothetical protein [Hymenobacter sp. YIM 151858-1]UYZ59767.1 hypothetical protein OIS50_02980 [Hymenobacter sp. YIM 151858-1]